MVTQSGSAGAFKYTCVRRSEEQQQSLRSASCLQMCACVRARALVCACSSVRVRLCARGRSARGSMRACAHAGMGKKADHVKCAFAIPDLRFESVQVWPGRIDLCDVPPPLPELVDRNGSADKERDGGYGGRQAECNPHLP